MKNSVMISIPGDPRGKGRPRFARRGRKTVTYTDDKTAAYENLVGLYATQAMKSSPPILGPLKLTIYAYMPIPASWSGKKKTAALAREIYPTGLPDIDNIAKAVLDGLNRIAFADDKQVVTLAMGKRYSDQPGLVVWVNQETYENGEIHGSINI